ncbi:MAG: Uma2 family endonuclease [Treponema sp.]|jgi:Uma2 family endonuclease|nr:Uma2 family endonuclease [Treponema sp.]
MSNAYSLEDAPYTYADVLETDEKTRMEIIDGEMFMMALPTTDHQIISRELFGQLWQFLKGKPYQVFSAPVGVRLFPRTDFSDDTFLEPDLVVVCDRSKITRAGCEGAPDMIIEILSPSNARHDRLLKFRKYLAAGVPEYWVVDGMAKTVEIHILDQGRYITTVAGENDEVPVSVLPGCTIKLRDIWSDNQVPESRE